MVTRLHAAGRTFLRFGLCGWHRTGGWPSSFRTCCRVSRRGGDQLILTQIKQYRRAGTWFRDSGKQAFRREGRASAHSLNWSLSVTRRLGPSREPGEGTGTIWSRRALAANSGATRGPAPRSALSC